MGGGRWEPGVGGSGIQKWRKMRPRDLEVSFSATSGDETEISRSNFPPLLYTSEGEGAGEEALAGLPC